MSLRAVCAEIFLFGMNRVHGLEFDKAIRFPLTLAVL